MRRDFLIGSAAAVGAAALGLPRLSWASTPAEALGVFGVSEALVRELLGEAMSRGGEFADLFFQRNTSSKLELKDGEVKKATSLSEVGVGVRVVRGTETGYAYTESLDRASLLEAARAAAAVAAGGSGSAPESLRTGRLPEYYPVVTPWATVPTSKKVTLLNRIEARVRELDARIVKVSVTFNDSHSDIVVVDSSGRLQADSQPMVTCYVSVTAEDKGRRESNYQGTGARAGLEFFTDEKIDWLAQSIVDKTLVLFEAGEAPAGELPVVLGAGSSGILLHEAIGHGMEADAARKGVTIYSDMLGKRIAPEFVTIVDDGTNKSLRGSINVDDEGESSQKTTLVEEGVLRTFIHDRISAKHYGVAPTGNGRRQSFRYMPIPRMRNTYMLAGPHEPEELIRSVKKGIYADHFTNGQVKVGQGDFTFYVKNGWLIEDGKKTRPIKDINIIGNGPDALRDVEMVANDFAIDTGGWMCGKRGQRVPVGIGLPSVKVSALTVGGTGRG